MSKMMDRLNLLNGFARIAERGSISAAARDIGLSQASLSRQLAALEQMLGVQLIHRTTHELNVTPVGRDVLARGRDLLAGWEALTDLAAGETTDIRGHLTVVAPVALGQQYLTGSAVAFQKMHPDVTVSWLLDDAEIRFAETGCDFWIRVGMPRDDTLIVQPLGRVERLVVGAPGRIGGRAVSAPGDLAHEPFVALSPFDGDRVSLHDAGGRSATLVGNAVLTTNNILSAKEAAIQGVGFAVMPRWFVADELDHGILIDVLPAWRAAALTINGCFLPMQRQTRRLRLFAEYMAAAVADVPGVMAVD